MSKVVFMTGSASGVGLHLTDEFVKRGYRVIATDINVADLKKIAKEKAWSSERTWIRKLDVTQKAQWLKLWQDVMDRWAGVDIICNVAGYLKPGMIQKTDMEEVDRHMNINVKGLMLGSKLAAQCMAEQGHGHIINVASLAGIAPVPGIALYSASKFAVRGFSLALAQEMKPLNVNVSVLCPDAIETPMLALQEDYEEAALTFSGSKTLTVEDISDAVFKVALVKKPIEIMLPRHRGYLAKLSNALPQISSLLAGHLRKAGLEKQAERLRQNQRH